MLCCGVLLLTLLGCDSETDSALELPLAIDLEGVSATGDGPLRVVPADRLLTAMDAVTISIADVNQDGMQDILVPSSPPQMMVNLGGRGFGADELPAPDSAQQGAQGMEQGAQGRWR